MKFDETTIRILVRKNYGECFDFYTEKIGLVPVWGDRNGPYTSFAINSGTPPCFAIFPEKRCRCFRGIRSLPATHSLTRLWRSFPRPTWTETTGG